MTKRKSAFTLIELLVVISILALLMSILVPSLVMAREQAKRVVCRSNVRQLALATRMYADENDEWLMPHPSCWADPWADVRVIGNPDSPSWWFGTPDYPEQPYHERSGGLSNEYTDQPELLGCPSDRLWGSDTTLATGIDTGLVSYIYRSSYTAEEAAKNNQSNPDEFFPMRMTQINNPQYVAVFGGRHHQYVGPDNGSSPSRKAPGAIHKKRGEQYAAGYNVAYLDGHADWVPGSTYYEYTHFILGDAEGGPFIPWDTRYKGTNAWNDWDQGHRWSR